MRIFTCRRQVIAIASPSAEKAEIGESVGLPRQHLARSHRGSLVVAHYRDLMVRGYRTYKEFLEASEGTATNTLADRLRKLGDVGILTGQPAETDGRRIHYRLTEKGIDLAPIVLDLLLWASRHEPTGAPCEIMAQMAKNRDELLTETYLRWRHYDSTPLLPTFGTADVSRSWRKCGNPD